MNTVISLAFKFGIMGRVVSPFAGMYAKAKGYRTQGLCIAAGIVYLCGFLGWVPMDDAKKYAEALLLMAIPTAGDKIVRFAKYAEMARVELEKTNQ